jgi:hypothetical protein
MKLDELKEMLEEDEFELNPIHVHWGCWADDLDLDSLPTKQNEDRINC